MKYIDFIREEYRRKNGRMIGTFYLMLLGILPVVFVVLIYLIISYSSLYNNRISLIEITDVNQEQTKEVKEVKDSINIFIYLENEKIITNIQGAIISWNKNQDSLELEKLNKELKKEIDKRLLLSFLRKEQMNNLMVTIFPGKGLRYIDVVPLIQAMSNVGISNYSFKGKNKKSSKNI